jgi:DNA-binding NtrC family response regulator
VTTDDDDIEGATRHVPRNTSPDGAVLVVLSGASKGATLTIPGSASATITIGKSDENDLVLRDETVSRKHLELTRVPQGLRVRDLGSTNGTRVGGAEIEEAIAQAGTILRVGDVEVLVGVAIDRVAVPTSTSDRFELALGKSEAMRRVFGVLERVAPTTASVLLTGETGTGKDVLARSIHQRSKRGAFEVVDCGAIVPSLMESELFGHERGAFTGAVSSRAGAFERAAGGTLFLDELGELPLELQPKLLRVLEARSFRRIGGDALIQADVRIVAATSRDLRAEVSAGRFREDLYYRLAVVALEVPPLRKRREDLPLLVESFVSDKKPSAALLSAFLAYPWPGNVRELRNVLERAAATSRGSELELPDFPPTREVAEEPASATYDPSLTYRETRARFEAGFEKSYVRWLLQRHAGNVSAAAREAKMDRTHLGDLMRKHGLRAR